MGAGRDTARLPISDSGENQSQASLSRSSNGRPVASPAPGSACAGAQARFTPTAGLGPPFPPCLRPPPLSSGAVVPLRSLVRALAVLSRRAGGWPRPWAPAFPPNQCLPLRFRTAGGTATALRRKPGLSAASTLTAVEGAQGGRRLGSVTRRPHGPVSWRQEALKPPRPLPGIPGVACLTAPSS